MKNIHFCTKELLIQLYEGQQGNTITTYRTGWTPGYYSGDVVNLNENNPDGKDFFICKGVIQYVLPMQYKEFSEHAVLHPQAMKEIKRYKRKFHPEHWFFEIGIKIVKLIKEVTNN